MGELSNLKKLMSECIAFDQLDPPCTSLVWFTCDIQHVAEDKVGHAAWVVSVVSWVRADTLGDVGQLLKAKTASGRQ